MPPTSTPAEGAPWQRSGYPIPVTTAFEFPEYPDVATIGPVSGVYATSLGFGRSLSAGFSSMSRGEVVDMTNLLAEARHVTPCSSAEELVQEAHRAEAPLQVVLDHAGGQMVDLAGGRRRRLT